MNVNIMFSYFFLFFLLLAEGCRSDSIPHSSSIGGAGWDQALSTRQTLIPDGDGVFTEDHGLLRDGDYRAPEMLLAVDNDGTHDQEPIEPIEEDRNLALASTGNCTADVDCTATVRSRSPLEVKEGVDICKCYTASTQFDECEGQDDSNCMIAKCINDCEGLETYCSAKDGSVCKLRPETPLQSSSSWPTWKTSDGTLIQTTATILLVLLLV